ncbi:hypothetical protein CJ178_04120 [Rhodococcus sp. ACPA4]|nr:hypothetical protein CJ178_04120 [Rhodococcus sp. ACPA4]
MVVIEAPNGQSALIVSHVVDHSRSEELVVTDQAVLVDLLADGDADELEFTIVGCSVFAATAIEHYSAG